MPRTSPTTMRSACIRRHSRSRLSSENSPAPSKLAGRASSTPTSGWRSGNWYMPSSSSSSTVIMRSSGGISLSSARHNVVLPVPIPPQMTILCRESTAALRKFSMASSNIPPWRSWASVDRVGSCIRMVTIGTIETSMMACRRLPLGRRMLSTGELVSKRRLVRPKLAPAQRICWISSSSEAATGSPRCFLPALSTSQTVSCPLMWMSLRFGSLM